MICVFRVQNCENVADKVGFAEKKLSFIKSGILKKCSTIFYVCLEKSCYEIIYLISKYECLADLDKSNYRIGSFLGCLICT